jgi:hypothetical protein
MAKVPKWVAEISAWWDDLLGPALTLAWEKVKGTGTDPKMLQAAYSEVVNRMERALDEADGAVADLAAAAGTLPDWQPVVQHVRDVLARVRGRWADPEASTPIGVSGAALGASLTGVVTTTKRVVTTLGIAWALATVAHVELLIAWVREQQRSAAEGGPAPRVRRADRVSGADVGAVHVNLSAHKSPAQRRAEAQAANRPAFPGLRRALRRGLR